jgi:hypothetical protein
MILDSVDQFFDKDIHQDMLKEIAENYSPAKIDEIVKKSITDEAKRYSGSLFSLPLYFNMIFSLHI